LTLKGEFSRSNSQTGSEITGENSISKPTALSVEEEVLMERVYFPVCWMPTGFHGKYAGFCIDKSIALGNDTRKYNLDTISLHRYEG
jgi:hypothetical protein